MSELVWYTDPDTGHSILRKPIPQYTKGSDLPTPAIQVRGVRGGGKQWEVSRQIPLDHPDAPRVDGMGRAVFCSEQEKRDFMAKTGATNDGRAIESGGYEAGVEAQKKAQAILPCEEEWRAVKNAARKSGDLPVSKDEPPSEQRRRKKAATKRRKKGGL